MPESTDSPRLSRRFDEALAYASRLHRTQVRKGTKIPYVSHLMAVTALALDSGADEDTAIAALLHDAVEDQGGAPVLTDIRERFGDRVAEIVDACSETDVDPKPPWRERKETYLEHLRSNRDGAVALVVAADKLHNVQSIVVDLQEQGEIVWTRFNASREEQLWFYRAVADALAAQPGAPRRLTGLLQNAVDQLGH